MKRQKTGGKSKIGKNKVKCLRYYNEGRRTKNKLANFKNRNIGKDWTENQIETAISNFMDLQRDRQARHKI